MSVLDSIRLPNRPDLLNCRTIDRLALPLLSEMERVGTAINVPGLQAMSVDLQARMLELEAKVRKHVPVDKLREFLNRKSNTPQRPPSTDNQFDSLSDSNYQDAMEAEDSDEGVGEGADEEIPVDSGLMNFAFNVNSAEKIAWLLFEVLDLGRGETLDTTPDGKRVSTGKKQLERLKDKHDVVKDLLDYREVAKLKSTYVDKLPRIAVRHDKGLCRYCGLRHLAATYRVHTQFVTTRTETSRCASRSPNLQNIPARSELGRAVRAQFIPTPGMKWVSVDKSQIELRSLAHCANDPIMLDIFRSHGDIHVRTAMGAFNLKSEAEVDKHLHRAPAKSVNFGICIAHGQRVLTDHGLVEIQNITCRDKVWDGIEFVSHEGVIFNGYHPVITHCGVTATPDHIVWTVEGRKVRIAEALAHGLELATTGCQETPIRFQRQGCFGHNTFQGREELPVRLGVLRQLRANNRGFRRQHLGRENNRMQMRIRKTEVRPSSGKETGRSVSRNQTAVRESGLRCLSELRRTWHQKQVRKLYGLRGVHTSSVAPPNVQESGDRPDRQRWALRTGESKIGNESGESTESTQQSLCDVQGRENRCSGYVQALKAGLPGFSSQPNTYSETGYLGSALAGDTATCTEGSVQEAEYGTVLVPVYDIRNAGPRHRFTVEGRLVSNCFGLTSKGLFAQLVLLFNGAGMPIPAWLTEQWCEDFINKWFGLYSKVRAYMDSLMLNARRHGMVWNEFGRVRQIYGVWSVHKHLVSECLRQAGNMPIQSFAAELMKLWMALVLDDHGDGLLPLWRERGLVYPLLTVHDELNFEAEESIADDMVADLLLAEEYMGEALGLRCPLLADGGVSDYWKK